MGETGRLEGEAARKMAHQIRREKEEQLGKAFIADTKKIHTSRHAALATAVRVLIEMQMLEKIGESWQVNPATRQMMKVEVAKWDFTDDLYAQGIMAPLKALS